MGADKIAYLILMFFVGFSPAYQNIFHTEQPIQIPVSDRPI